MFVCSTAVGKDFFHVPESTSSDLNAVANSAGPDENIHKSSLVKANTVCHLTLAVLTLLSCNQS